MPLLLVVGAVAVVTVGAPMVSGAVTSFTDPVALESTATSTGAPPATTGTGGSSSSSRGSADGPLVRMGVDGDPAPQTPAGAPATPSAGTSAPVAPSVPAAEVPEPTSDSAEVPAAEGEPAAGVELPAVEAETEPAPVTRAAAAAADPTAEAAVLALVNEARADAGCGALTADPALAAVARAHSADMRDRDYFSHTSPEGLSPFDRAEQAGVGYSRAENIAFGQSDAAAVMEAWLESPGHRENILDCDLTRLGVGVAEGPGGPWWTQLFGA
ncbi:CAP domain-containing protein [Geodermatophilus obscurus]|uniref:CAP domain-containing protein n=1 Tax=Geodermatophilus obscurus TaxID=1861 RepID=UPI00019B802D|nr:CAP domain-containing protein [Geodermatophilus obscurus]